MNLLKISLIYVGVTTAAFLPNRSYSAVRSFNEVKQALDSTLLDALPERASVAHSTVVGSFLEAKTHTLEELRALVKSGSFIDRILKTFSTDDDFKEDDRAKYIHSMGACASAEWKIDRSPGVTDGDATGLFAPTANPVRGIVRLSVSVEKARYKPGEKRAWGFALKLFPGEDPNQPTASRNLLFFDRYGLDGSDRPLVLGPAKGDHSVQFINFINDTGVTSFTSRAISALFSLFDSIATYRPLDGFAAVDSENLPVEKPEAPTFLVLRARPVVPSDEASANQADALRGLDFRNELRSYPSQSIVFDLFVGGSSREDLAKVDTRTMTKKALALHKLLDDPKNPQAPPPIGTLTLGALEVSTDCDLRLHFSHDPNRR